MKKTKIATDYNVYLIYPTFIICGLILSFNIIAWIKVDDLQECNVENCVSDDCYVRECIKGVCQVTYTSPLCCTSLQECLDCNPFGLDRQIEYYYETALTNVIANQNCTTSIYVQESVITPNTIIVECFSTYENSQCNSTFGIVTVNGTMVADLITSYNSSTVNINSLIIDVFNNTGYFNSTNGTVVARDITINETLFVDQIQSCVNGRIDADGASFFPNGTLAIQNVTIQNLNISSLDNLEIYADVNVQGILINNGSISGYNNNQYSNILYNNIAWNAGVGYSQVTESVQQKLSVNGTLGTKALLFYPNNCTNQDNCLLNYYYEWTGRANTTGMVNNTFLDLQVLRFGKTVFFTIGNLSDLATTPVAITASLRNSTTSSSMNVTNFLNTNRVVTNEFNVWVPSLFTVVYGMVKIDTLGILQITFDPHYSFSQTPYYWNTFTFVYTLYD